MSEQEKRNPVPENIDPKGRFGFSFRDMRRNTKPDDPVPPDEQYSGFQNTIAGVSQPLSPKAQADLTDLKNGRYMLQPVYSPMDIPEPEDLDFHLAE